MAESAIYLIYCRHCVGQNALMALHATFDGAFSHMKQILKLWEDEKGFYVIRSGTGFYVNGPNNFYRYFYIVTRTIEE